MIPANESPYPKALPKKYEAMKKNKINKIMIIHVFHLFDEM